MTHPNQSTALARVVVDEMSARGVGMTVISPGSRSGALAIAASEHPDMDTRVFIDERSAAFHALGVARASGRPVAVVSTSGTAPANFFPAIVEADMACVPIVAVSADRPSEMRGVGANQTIDQIEMFGSKVRGFAAIEASEPASDANLAWRSTVARLLAVATAPKPGPVHLNVAFREPTVPVSDDGRTPGEPYPFETPRIEDLTVSGTAHGHDIPPVLEADRGVVIAGDGAYPRDALLEIAGRLRWPVLATALSGLRGAGVVSTYHHLLADGVPEELRPQTVVTIGAIGPSLALESLVSAAEHKVRVDLWGRVIDPNRNASHVLSCDPVSVLDVVSGAADPGWAAVWHRADTMCRRGLLEAVHAQVGLSGAAVAVVLNDIDWQALVVASSLPIREVDAHLTRAGPVFANRGASGIDGFVSSALGVASTHQRTLALTGDLSLLHDANGFLNDAHLDLTMVVIDNQGGGLFDSLPQARYAPSYERLFVTPPRRNLQHLAELHRARFTVVESIESLRAAANAALHRGGIELISVPVDRSYDLMARSQLVG